MRGLPFRVTEHDICEWFSSVADPVDVFIHFNDDGRLVEDIKESNKQQLQIHLFIMFFSLRLQTKRQS